MLPSGQMSLPLWLIWARLADSHAAQAETARPSDRVVDATSLALQTPGSKVSDFLSEAETPELAGRDELEASLVAVIAAALAIDGLYGATKPFVNSPSSKARRERQIIETLKLGFAIGRESHRWLPGLTWLFKSRDIAVHHQEDLRPITISRVTDEPIVCSAMETELFWPFNARRAANLCNDIIAACLRKPKPATRTWAAKRALGVTDANK